MSCHWPVITVIFIVSMIGWSRGFLTISANLRRRNFGTVGGEDIFFRVLEPAEAVVVVKKSKFIAHISPAQKIEEAMAIVEQIKDPKASHNCWAFCSANYHRYSDDGEPTNTAGKPILNALESEKIQGAVVVVTRHFGGTKLGTGGLIRAYFLAAQTVIRATNKVQIIPTRTISISSSIADLGNLHLIANTPGVSRISESFGSTDMDSVTLVLRVPQSLADELGIKFQDLCKGQGSFEDVTDV